MDSTYFSLEYAKHLPRVRNQRNCTSCWSFTSTAAVAAAFALLTGKIIELSPQHPIDKVTYEPSDQTDENGCKTHYGEGGLKFIKENGVYFEKDYEYKACRAANPEEPEKKPSVTMKIKNIVKLPNDQKRETIQAVNAILLSGSPIVGTIIAGDSFRNLKKGEVFKGEKKNTKTGAHSILIVGFGRINGSLVYRFQNTHGEKYCDNGLGFVLRDIVLDLIVPEDPYLEGNCDTTKYETIVPPYDVEKVLEESAKFYRDVIEIRDEKKVKSHEKKKKKGEDKIKKREEKKKSVVHEVPFTQVESGSGSDS